MSKNVYRLVCAITDGVAAIAEGIAVYAGTRGWDLAVPFAASIPVAVAAIEQICLNFVTKDSIEAK